MQIWKLILFSLVSVIYIFTSFPTFSKGNIIDVLDCPTFCTCTFMYTLD